MSVYPSAYKQAHSKHVKDGYTDDINLFTKLGLLWLRNADVSQLTDLNNALAVCKETSKDSRV